MSMAGVEQPVTRGQLGLARSPERAERAAGPAPGPHRQGRARPVLAWRVSARPGRRGESWLGTSGPGWARRGLVRQAWQGAACSGASRLGLGAAWQARWGGVRHGQAGGMRKTPAVTGAHPTNQLEGA
jgi:hypothetical protein